MGQKKSNEEVQWRGGFRVCVCGGGGGGSGRESSGCTGFRNVGSLGVSKG